MSSKQIQHTRTCYHNTLYQHIKSFKPFFEIVPVNFTSGTQKSLLTMIALLRKMSHNDPGTHILKMWSCEMEESECLKHCFE